LSPRENFFIKRNQALVANMKIKLIALIFLFFPVISWGDVCREITGDVIKKHLGVNEFQVVSKRDINGICELIISIDSRIIPFYGNKKFLISGEMYEKGASLTKDRIYDINRARIVSSLNEIDRNIVFTYKPSSVKKDTGLYMFTDPLCPYCNKIGNEIRELADRLGFEVHVLLLNVHGERGRVKCIEAICRNLKDPAFNLAEYNSMEWKKGDSDKKYFCEKGGELLDRIEGISEKTGIDSVPFFFINDGSHVSGASIEEVERLFSAGK